MKQEKGFSLIEVALAIAILGIVAVAFLGALATGSKTIFIADERATAESLARAQMEYVRGQNYSSAPWDYTLTSSQRSSTDEPAWWDDANDIPPLLSSDYDGYTVEIHVVPLNGALDDGIQEITAVISHLGEEVCTLEDYRSWR
jgi:prepilin-type N-terminal cleavage/methylation domain-containing protein